MFRPMRRKGQALPPEACAAILRQGSCGVLALAGDDGYPYAVPVSYVHDGERIYFHSAKAGHKLDAIQREPKASLCVVDQDLVVPEEYTSYFRSVIAFGVIHPVEAEEEKWAAIEKLALKYAPHDTAANRRETIQREWEPLCMLRMDIQHLTGKEAIELVRQRQQEASVLLDE